ncbi:hypothetical protein [Phocaeicola plebeius]|uniref:hypothetical protein n=1 Tax=Phocaeicola plebeius TaxID=310297 RepID=UPI0039915AD6
MKLTDKRFWNGEKKVYYPSFKYALTDSLLWSILWTGIIYLLLSVSCLIIHFTNGSNLSWDDISFILIFQCIVFGISNGMFLYENWYKQKCTIRKIKRLLPNEYHWQHIEYNAIGKKYTIQGDYQGKVFIIKVVYPILYIKEKGGRAVTGIGINANKKILEKDKLLIFEFFEYKKS